LEKEKDYKAKIEALEDEKKELREEGRSLY